jgi:hypothetical protein
MPTRRLISSVDRYCALRDEAAAMDREALAAEIVRLDQLVREAGPLPATAPLTIRLAAFADEFKFGDDPPF